LPSGWCCGEIDVLKFADLQRMADAGCNLLRLWPDPNETGKTPDKLVDVLRWCEDLGIRCMISILNPGELSDLFIEGPPNLRRIRNAYRSVCEVPEEILSKPAAREISRRRIDDVLEAVGDSRAVAAWVVASQVDGVYQASNAVVQEWVAEMARHLRTEEYKRLGRNRLVCATSYDPLPSWDAIYGSDLCDFTALHGYSPSAYAPVDSQQSAVEFAFITSEAHKRTAGRRPVFMNEYGPLLHLFLADHQPLPIDLLTRWRSNTAFAHLCGGGAGSPLLVPPYVFEADAPAATNVTDQIRPVPCIIPTPLAETDRAFRRVVADVVFERLAFVPLELHYPPGTLGAACGDPAGGFIIWLARDRRLEERTELVRRYLCDDGEITVFLAYDAARAILEAEDRAVWNPQTRIAIGRLARRGQKDVAEERAQLEVRKLARILDRRLEASRGLDLGGTVLTAPANGPQAFRCYDPTSGDVVASGVTSGDVALPPLSEVVVVLERASARQTAWPRAM